MTDSVYWIWFQLVFGIGTRRAELFLNYFEHPREIYGEIEARGRVLGMLEPDELSSSGPALEKAREVERRTDRKGCVILTPDHPDYPPLLRSLYNHPAVLYCKGDLTCLQEGALAIAMVGTRKRTEYGKRAAAVLAGALAGCGVVVVSGLAPGIDAECHRAALAAGGKTVGVLGCGIDVDYPKPNRALKTAVSQNGAVVTEFPLGYPPMPENFPLRNRILSGMSHGTVVVEADLRSGSLITARYAQEQGRDVFAVPGSIFQREEQGTHLLIKEGARLADCADDILDVYSWYVRRSGTGVPVRLPEEAHPPPRKKERRPKPPTGEKRAAPLPEGATPSASQVYAVFSQDTITVDDIAHRTGLGAGEVLSALTELELYGLVQGYPGRRFGLS